MQRYLVFAGDHYYPSGGWHDYHRSFASLDSAIAYCKRHEGSYQWWHIVDATKGKIAVQHIGGDHE